MNKILQIIENIKEEIVKNKEYLTDLDRKIGDADHGENMVRGFKLSVEALKSHEDSSLETIFKTLGMTLLNKVGGASGPLYGMAFVKGSKVFANASEIKKEHLKNFINEATLSIKTLGKATLGDKTMLDVWENVNNDLKKDVAKEALLANVQKYVESTKEMQAKRGRASFLRERSIGTIDPGSVSTEIILRHLIKEFY